MKAEFLTAKEVRKDRKITRTQLAQWVGEGLPFEWGASPWLQMRKLKKKLPELTIKYEERTVQQEMLDFIAEHKSTKDIARQAYLFDYIKDHCLGYMLFPAHEVEKFAAKEPIPQKHKPYWNTDTNTLYGFDGKPHMIKGSAQINVLNVLSNKCGGKVHKRPPIRRLATSRSPSI